MVEQPKDYAVPQVDDQPDNGLILVCMSVVLAIGFIVGFVLGVSL